MSETFRITYEVDDGYVGRSRPKYTSIGAGDLSVDEDEQGLKDMFWEEIQRDFGENCHPYSKQEAEFVEWAKAQIAKESKGDS